MANLNKVLLAGNLTKDPEIRFTPSGLGICNFTLAVNTVIGKDENNQLRTEVLFIDIVAFGKQAETVANYLKKGSNVFVDGRLRYRTWEDSSGNKRAKHEIIMNSFQFLSPKDRDQETTSEAGLEDEDIPF